MRRLAVILTVAMMFLLCGCGDISGAERAETPNPSEAQKEITAGAKIPEIPTEDITDTDVVQGGPYGEISISIPIGWSYELCSIDSEELTSSGMYGIHFFPEGATQGYIELVYMDFFGVCGTGLAVKNATIAGKNASIGTYDDHEYWDYISFTEQNSGIVALTYFVDDWWSEYGDQTLDILDTLSFDPDIREGGAYIREDESQISEIGLSLSLKDISPTGATLVFNLYDAEAANGQLIYGDDFTMEVLTDGEWESAPIILEGNYGFHDIAYLITPEDGDSGNVSATGNTIVESEISWEWLYGELKPGEYRLGKSIFDTVENGNSRSYMIYAHFILN